VPVPSLSWQITALYSLVLSNLKTGVHFTQAKASALAVAPMEFSGKERLFVATARMSAEKGEALSLRANLLSKVRTRLFEEVAGRYFLSTMTTIVRQDRLGTRRRKLDRRGMYSLAWSGPGDRSVIALPRNGRLFFTPILR
jgi:hypothetical protein